MWDDAPDWYLWALWDDYTGQRALCHLYALANTPFTPKSSRCRRRDKTRDYRRHSWPRQPEGGRYETNMERG